VAYRASRSIEQKENKGQLLGGRDRFESRGWLIAEVSFVIGEPPHSDPITTVGGLLRTDRENQDRANYQKGFDAGRKSSN
jgi:hypothetical protein